MIKKLKIKKYPGENEINNGLLTFSPMKAIILLTFIFNASVKLQYYPTAWKNAIICAIPKPNKNHSMQANYRPISLLSAVSIIFEGITLKTVNEINKALKIIPNTQFGFRPDHSCDQQLVRVIKDIKLGFLR